MCVRRGVFRSLTCLFFCVLCCFRVCSFRSVVCSVRGRLLRLGAQNGSVGVGESIGGALEAAECRGRLGGAVRLGRFSW